ncbi:calcium-binding protein, partial [Pseudomonas sp. BGM005]|nr:calcium-binding protein [Pseudomonas sp. BG5]
ADILIGGVGDDAYIVDNVADVVTERPNEGADLTKTTLSSYALTNNVENLTFIGTGDFAGTGNRLANTITGGAGNDTLDGGAGNDTLDGGGGNDIYVVDSASDVIKDSAGTDEIRTALAAYSIAALANIENLTYTGSASFSGAGNALANTITGGAGNDMLNGGAGADSLIGGAGHDTYIVDHAGDTVIEAADAGTDTV